MHGLRGVAGLMKDAAGRPLPPPEGPTWWPYGLDGLEIGGGPHALRLKCRQFDLQDWSDRTGLKYDLGDARALPYQDETFDYVFASNLLEHFPAGETTSVLSEWARVLRVGGMLQLVVPDSMHILRGYHAGAMPWEACEERLLGSRSYDGNDHKAAFTISDFPDVIADVPRLELVLCESSHQGDGIHAVTRKY